MYSSLLPLSSTFIVIVYSIWLRSARCDVQNRKCRRPPLGRNFQAEKRIAVPVTRRLSQMTPPTYRMYVLLPALYLAQAERMERALRHKSSFDKVARENILGSGISRVERKNDANASFENKNDLLPLPILGIGTSSVVYWLNVKPRQSQKFPFVRQLTLLVGHLYIVCCSIVRLT